MKRNAPRKGNTHMEEERFAKRATTAPASGAPRGQS
jgi:hypothetical protein